MELKGTKGEWKVVDFGNEIIVQSDNQDHIVTIRRTSTTRVDKLYNAHLIATAPELLDALIRLKTMYQDLEKTLYGQNMTVNNWHLNGDTEPIDSFFEDLDLDAIEYAENTISKALNK